MLKSNTNFKTTSYTNTLSTPLVLPSSQQSTIPSSITNATLLTPFSHPNNPPLSNHYNSITVHTHTAILLNSRPLFIPIPLSLNQHIPTHARAKVSTHTHIYSPRQIDTSHSPEIKRGAAQSNSRARARKLLY